MKMHFCSTVCWCSLFFSILFTPLSILPRVSAQEPQSDYDGDGFSDITMVTSLGRRLSWSAMGSSTGLEIPLGKLGAPSDKPIPARWLGTTTPQIGVVSKNKGTLVWKIITPEGETLRLPFGSGNSTIISGADFNGNGLADAATVTYQGKKITWNFRLDMFVPGAPPIEYTMNFGTKGEPPFYVSPDGVHDWAAVVRKTRGGKSVIRLRNVITGKVRILSRFGAYITRRPKPRILSLESENGKDLLVFVRKGKKRDTAFVRTVKGRLVKNIKLPTTGSEILVGNFLPNPGEELAIATGSAFIIINPRNRLRSVIQTSGGLPFDHINITSFGQSTKPDPDPKPTSSPGDPQEGCTRVQSWPGSHIYKTIGSTHFTDIRRNTAGVIIEPGGQGPFPDCIFALDTNGNSLASFGLYARGNGWEARYYAGIGCGTSTPLNGAALAGQARANTGSPNILLNFGSVCYGPIDAGHCIGSGQC